jgi:hypothetical protein
MEEIVNTKMFDQVKKGLVKIDDILDKYPVFKRLVGLPLAGLLFYISLHIPCIGDFDFDFDFQEVYDSITGKFKVANLFATPDALVNVLLLITGTWVTMSFPWLSKDVYTILVGIAYTGAKNSEISNLAMIFEPVVNWM